MKENGLLNESLEVSTKAIDIFKEYKDMNYEIDEFSGKRQFANQLVQRARLYKDLFRYDESIKDYEQYLNLVSIKDLKELSSGDYLSTLSEVEFIYSTKGDSKNELKYLLMRYDIIQQYNKSDLKLQAKINRQVGSSYSSTDQFEKAVYHFDLSLDFIEKALSNNSSYSNKKDLYIDKEIALLGKLNNEQSIKQNLAEYKKVYSILSSMNNELKLLDKTTAQ